MGVKWDRECKEQEWERRVGWANGLRFDGDATDKTECSESTASLYQLILSTYDLPCSK